MNIYDEITKKFKKGDKIPLLTNEKFDIYIETTSTKVNGIFYEKAILFEISATNKKCVTSKFIELTYDYFIKNNYCFPNRDWYRNHDLLKHEDKSRPCNYSVVQGLIKVTLDTKTP
jgi:hypothetical protein